jgi:hypothetical protein
MGQWRGQFSGLTHASKVEDVEAVLRHAVVVYRELSDPESRAQKARAVRKLAARLLRDRLKMLKALAADARPVNQPSPLFDKRSRLIAETRAAGVPAILAEFGAAELVTQDSN